MSDITGTAGKSTDSVFAGELSACHIGHLIRFYVQDDNREIVLVVTAELRQLSHTGEDTTVIIGLGAEKEYTLDHGLRVIINPQTDYADVPHHLGNDNHAHRKATK